MSIRPCPEPDVLIEDRAPGRPLVISFGFAQWERPPACDFQGRLKKIEWILGESFQKIHLRDTRLAWYLQGVHGLGPDLPSTISSLRALIDELRPARIITLGQSMGGYGAILYGRALAAARVVAFGALSTMELAAALRHGDRRWLPVMQSLQDAGIPGASTDLVDLLADRATETPELRLHYGCAPDAPEHGHENLDLLHARRFQALAGTSIRLHPAASHAVSEHLRARGELDTVLLEDLFDVPAELVHSRGHPRLTDDWIQWIAENRIRNADMDGMIHAMEARGIAGITARSAIATVIRDPLYQWAARTLSSVQGP
ncbi:hypothetical protein G8A07_02230 [Roseateles sp. DAIF2]|uniref:hypothetical protein n=1 Tax=Roseateles sp. DAIF2 TaxID=2714952 RepID=UPI0018A3023B|nr:hypothetical protein [Roseateles sp. DAIF2]QPF71862.1 hypothetical protein G8A07_02230 [Roseateles sp. DAIF2]